jgi:acetylornithine deacetylase/succinyl-diaminopimelate desuccinylase-like protein
MIPMPLKRFPGQQVRGMLLCSRSRMLSFVFALFVTRAAFAQSTPVVAPVPTPQGSPMGTLPQEALTWLQDLIRINTTNPPGNEMAAANYVADVLQRENIPHEIIELSPGRGVVIGRLQANIMPDSAHALLLIAHMDVVGVTREKWTVDPFAAIIQNGYLYGRGAIDDKGMLAANLAAIVALKRFNVPLARDVIFLGDDDEEEFGPDSLKTLIAQHWDKIAAGFALNEGGSVVLQGSKVLYVGVQIAEKVPVNVTVIATGTSGHASQPRPDNAVVHLAAAIEKIGAYEAPVKFVSTTERYFEDLAKVEDEDTAKWIRALEQPTRQALAEERLADMSPAWNAMMRDTVTPTMLSAGVRANVIPSEARANLNVRLLPGDSINDVLADLKKLANDPAIRFEIAPDAGIPSPPSSMESPLYQAIERASITSFPGAVVMPYMSTGSTDSAQLRLRDVQAYGLLPFPLTAQDVLRMHADDERVPLASFNQGVEYLYRIVSDFVSRK